MNHVVAWRIVRKSLAYSQDENHLWRLDILQQIKIEGKKHSIQQRFVIHSDFWLIQSSKLQLEDKQIRENRTLLCFIVFGLFFSKQKIKKKLTWQNFRKTSNNLATNKCRTSWQIQMPKRKHYFDINSIANKNLINNFDNMLVFST